MKLKPDHFADKAKEWDSGDTRVKNARSISDKILKLVSLQGDEHIMDFGAGTGLLSEGIAPHIRKLTAIDYSEAMLARFCAKDWPCETEALQLDLSKAKLDHRFDGIISSMTLHHIKDVNRLFVTFEELLKPGGFIALADLEKEDGTFHSSNKGVEHFGFEKEEIGKMLEKAGFSSIQFDRANTITKEVERIKRDFPIFLVFAEKI